MLCFTTFENLAEDEAIPLETQTGVRLVLLDSATQEYSVSIFSHLYSCQAMLLCHILAQNTSK